MGKKTTRTARFLFCANAGPVLPLFRRPHGLKARRRQLFFLLLSRFRRPLFLISFCENAHTKALRQGNLLFAAAKLSFAPTKPLFAPTKPSFAAAKQDASGSKILKEKDLQGAELQLRIGKRQRRRAP
ncbi:hypothetical protein [Alloprevotella tannerae]|uniref:hypothetical protein n=1 Tax=Alloprevotella tannerae TaxID=76122 RepID=UPI0028E403B8|nr:hypothetical protein [Alloprevotella tannerae]